MSKELFHISLTRNALSIPEIKGATTRGAHVAFSGVVRDLEDARPIDGILYSAYQDMAQQLLQEIATKGQERFTNHGLWIEHRLGFVAAGEPSLVIVVTTTHGAEAFEITQWYLKEIKTKLTVWKEPRFSVSGEPALDQNK